MTCASCVMHVEQGLKETPGVEKAVVNLATERATVKYDPQTATLPDMVWHVQDVGYDVITDKVELPLENVQDKGKVESALRAVAGVLNATLTNDRATIEIVPGAATIGDLRAAIEAAGAQVADDVSSAAIAEPVDREL